MTSTAPRKLDHELLWQRVILPRRDQFELGVEEEADKMLHICHNIPIGHFHSSLPA